MSALFMALDNSFHRPEKPLVGPRRRVSFTTARGAFRFASAALALSGLGVVFEDGSGPETLFYLYNHATFRCYKVVSNRYESNQARSQENLVMKNAPELTASHLGLAVDVVSESRLRQHAVCRSRGASFPFLDWNVARDGP
jgi:hypothetical protein